MPAFCADFNKVNYEVVDNILKYFGSFLLSVPSIGRVLVVTLKWSVLSTSRRHNVGKD